MRLIHAWGSRILRAPENDLGSINDEIDDYVPGADEGDDDAGDPDDSDEGGVDLAGADDDGGDHDDEGQEPAQVGSRASRRETSIQVALRELKEEREALARERAGQTAALTERQRADAAAAERARVEAMDPYERRQYESEQALQATRSEIQQLRFETYDSGDRANFKAECASNPALAKVADRVESELRRIRGNGQNTDRMTVAAFVIGQMALERAKGATTRQGKRGAANIARETARPVNGRGDVGSTGARRGADTPAARKARLENMEI